MTINYNNSELIKRRREIFHSKGLGYSIFRNYLNAKQIDHLRTVWQSEIVLKNYVLGSKNDIKFGCNNFKVITKNNSVNSSTMMNFLWNKSTDTLTEEICINANNIRNILSGRDLNYGTVKKEGPFLNYRIVNTQSGTPVLPHRDWAGKYDGKVEIQKNQYLASLNGLSDEMKNILHSQMYEWMDDYSYDMKELKMKQKFQYDPSRLQATIILSKFEKDFSGDAFIFQNNRGEIHKIIQHEELIPGDLLIFKYLNIHSVENILCNENQNGFLRIILPQE